jgi:hypothetical protein
MAYRLPTFNLTCNIWTGNGPILYPTIPAGHHRLAVSCQLTYGRRVTSTTPGPPEVGPNATEMQMCLQVPKLTDIRGPQDVGGPDIVEVPAGSSRWYTVLGVDDIGKGFANEHRTAVIGAIPNTWTPPYA